MKQNLISMKKLALVAMCAFGISMQVSAQLTDYTVAGVTQIGNSDFEDWPSNYADGVAPTNWNSFKTAEGTFKSFVNSNIQVFRVGNDKRPGTVGNYSVKLAAKDVSLAIAQGNLTVGCINAGAMTAEGKNNYNYSKTADASKSETLTARPDSIVFWAKFLPGGNDSKLARMSAFIHDNNNYITYGKSGNDTDANKAYVVAKSELDFTTDGQWKRFSVPFTYNPYGKNNDNPQYIIVNFSTSNDPGLGNAKDTLYVDDVELLYNKTYTEDMVVTLDGMSFEPQSVNIVITNHADGSIDFSLKNFTLMGAPIGTILLPNVELTQGTNTATFTTTQTIQILPGDDPDVPADGWAGPEIGEIPITMNGELNDEHMEVSIDINIGMIVNVHVGYDLKQADVAFGIDYSTLCLPFDADVPEGVTAYTLGGLNGNVLNLVDAGNKLQAGKAYILEDATHGTYSFSDFIGKYFSEPVTAEVGSGAAYLQGVLEATTAPVGSYVLQNLNDDPGFYQAASGKQPTVPANRCYLVTTDSSVKGYKLNPNGTGIAIQTADEAPQTVYDLAGRRVTKMQKGIYIVNGKKVLK